MSQVQSSGENDAVVAANLFKARTRYGLYRAELAEILGIHEVQLARYENGLDPIPASSLMIAAHFIGVDFDSFFNENGVEELSEFSLTPVEC